MRKLKVQFLSAVMAVLLVLGSINIACAEEERKENRYNVVFVTDESGSMEETDPEQLRYEAIRRFSGLTAEEGNNLGSVSFNSDIVAQQKVQAIEGFAQKNNFVNAIEAASSPGWTNIGLGLSNAVDTLDNDRNQSLPSVIILLTDGNTDMGNDEKTQESLALKADAIERARQSGYKIFTICLNTDGSADIAEMQQIASATGGEFTEVTNPEDLEEVETIYYKMIFGGIDPEPDPIPIQIDENGVAQKVFEVPNVGVEEINIIFEGMFDKCQVTDPSGYVYQGEELESISMKGKSFHLVKILNPIGGTWKAEVFGNPGVDITFKLLYNSSFSIETSIDPTKDYGVGKEVTFSAKISDKNGVVDDISEYEKFEGTLYITSNGEETEYKMELADEGFVYKYEIPNKGTYYASIKISDGEMSAESEEPYELNVDNQAPIPPKEKLRTHVNRWPFLGGTATLDLKDTAKDPDKEKLVYEIESSAFNEDEYSLDGTVLKVTKFSIPKGSFTVRATDAQGAFCTFDVLVTSTNIGLVMALAVGLGGLLILVILGIIIYKKQFIPFMGTITVEKYDENNSEFIHPVSLTPGRGSVRLESFASVPGLPAGCKFQAGGKDKNIYFVSKKPVYSDMSAGPVKKIKIEGSGSEVRISGDSNMEKGITVIFKSILYNQFF